MSDTQSTVRIAKLYDSYDLRIEHCPPRPVLPGQVAIAPHFCGICGSDLHHYFHSDFAAYLKQPHPLTGVSLPVSTGHEFAGVITEIGQDCHRGLKVGDKVTVFPLVSDGTCRSCTAGSPNTCIQAGFIGVHAHGGGLSDRAVLHEQHVFKLPDSMDCDIGALVEPLAVGWHAINLAEPLPRATTTVILGGGAVGCAVLLCLRARGIRSIFVCEPSPFRRQLALDLGATAVFDPVESDNAQDIAARVGAEGVDVVFECAGAPSTLAAACAMARPQGTIVNLALSPAPVSVVLLPFVMKELSLKFSLAYTPDEFQQVIDAIGNGSLDARKMITKRIRLEDVVTQGLEPLHGKDSTDCKILIDLSL